MAIEVRPALAGDADALLSLIRAHAAFERGVADVTAAELCSAMSGVRPMLRGWVAEDAGIMIGYATVTRDYSTWQGRAYLHLDCLFVAAGQRGRGIGARLLAAVRRHAADEDIAEVQWQTPEWNEDAARFYVREGATAAAKLRFTLPT